MRAVFQANDPVQMSIAMTLLGQECVVFVPLDNRGRASGGNALPVRDKDFYQTVALLRQAMPDAY
jgi:hypothetical protein